ncbi:MAG: hypothetical protein WC654_01635 [Patescibacteria group bacterium]
MQDHLLLHLVGAAYCGKTTACQHLAEQFHGTRISSSEPFRVMVREAGRKVNRQTLSDTAEAFREKHGVRAVVDLLAPMIQQAPTRLVIVDGVRYPGTLAYFLQLSPRMKSRVIGVRASYDVRLTNARKHGTELTLTHLIREDMLPTEHSTNDLLAMADAVVENDGTETFLLDIVRHVEAWLYTHITPTP